MRRTEARQGVRMMKFMDVFGRWEAAELNQLEAAELLGVGERTFRRWCRRYEEDGEAGLLDRRLGKASGKRVPVDREQEVEALYRTRYQGFTARALPRASGARPPFRLELQLDEGVPASRRVCWRRRRGAARTGASGRAVRCRG